MPKKVVYLLGSGATHAVVKNLDIEASLLTSDIQDFLRTKSKPRDVDLRDWNELITTKDVEHLISVLDFQHKRTSSERARSYYRSAIISLARDALKGLPVNLYTILCDLHLNLSKTDLDEELTCFLTLNYEDILERTIRKHHRRQIDYGIETDSPRSGRNIIVFKLHGSFNWRTTYPVEVRPMASISNSKALWIPPGVDKRKENYPFNLLWGKATEALMDCDILRLVGCSLSRNDWGLIPILYTVQKFHSLGSMSIEVIDFPLIGQAIQNNYGYLGSVKRFDELAEVLGQYRAQFATATDSELSAEIRSVFEDRDKTNPFKAWLEAKIESVITNASSGQKALNTAGFAYRFYNKVDA